MSRRISVFHDDDQIKILRKGSGGKKQPPSVEVKFKQPLPQGHQYRTLEMTIDELFDLTEILDDLCDTIEDDESRLA